MLNSCWRRGLLMVIVVLIYALWAFLTSSTSLIRAHAHQFPGISAACASTFASNAHNNTLVVVPVNSGMLHLARNLLCSLQRTDFNTSSIIFWALDEEAEAVLGAEGYSTCRDPSLFAVDTNENRRGATKAYRRMMKERPKFFINALSAGYDLLMLDADTVFWQSPLSIAPSPGEDVDLVYSTDAREFYQTHNAFHDTRRRGSAVPPICNGIFWMKHSHQTMALWTEMLDVFDAPPPLGWYRRMNFQDDQRGMDVLLNDGRAEIVQPFPNGITLDMIRTRNGQNATLKVRLLDQTQVVNGHLLMNRPETYDRSLLRLQQSGSARIAAHFNWDTKDVSKEDGARRKGMYFLDDNGSCNANSSR